MGLVGLDLTETTPPPITPSGRKKVKTLPHFQTQIGVNAEIPLLFGWNHFSIALILNCNYGQVAKATWYLSAFRGSQM